MDKALNIAQNLLSKLTIKEKVNFVRFPLLIMWLCMPLALWGYIITKEMLLFYTFLGLIVFNIAISIIVYFVITKTQNKELKIAYEYLDKAIEHFKDQLKDLVEIVIELITGIMKSKKIKNKTKSKKDKNDSR